MAYAHRHLPWGKNWLSLSSTPAGWAEGVASLHSPAGPGFGLCLAGSKKSAV